MSKNCPVCKAALPDTAKFCGVCGNRLGEIGASTEKTEILTPENDKTELLETPVVSVKAQNADNEPTDLIQPEVAAAAVNAKQNSLPANGIAVLRTKYPIKALLGVVPVALVCAAAIIVTVILLNSNPANKTERYLDSAARYMLELNYAQAIIEFDKILEIDPMNVDAYLGKAKAYHAIGETDKAIKTLKDGYEKTGDDRIWELLKEYDSDILASLKEPTYETAATSYARISGVDGGYIAASEDNDGLWYFIDTSGEKLSNGYKSIWYFVGDYGLVTTTDDRVILINSDFEEVLDFSDNSILYLFNKQDPLVLCWHEAAYDDENDYDTVKILKPDGTTVYSWKENEGVSGGGVSIEDDPLTPDDVLTFECDDEYHQNLWLDKATSSLFGNVYYNSELDRIFVTYVVETEFEYDHTGEEAAWAAEDEKRRQEIIANGGGIDIIGHNTHGHGSYNIQTYEIHYANGKISLEESPRIVAADDSFTIDIGFPSPMSGYDITLTKGESKEYIGLTYWENSQIGDVYNMYNESLFMCSLKKADSDDADKYALFKPKWYESSETAYEKVDTEWEQLSDWYDDISELDANSGTFLVEKGDKWGFIDASGKELAMFDDASNFKGGFAVVTENGRGRVVDEDFQQIGEDFACESAHVIGDGIFAAENGGVYSIVAVK